MAARSLFEIIGPVMIGPSSSHTAGAVKIGRFARAALAGRPVRAQIVLYGSFAKTYRGHGTDKALIGGLLGMQTDDARIRDAFEIAKKEGLNFTFTTSESADLHPNTVGITLQSFSQNKVYIEGSSIGGGKIIISRINDYEVGINGEKPTLLIEHEDKPGVIGRVTTLLGTNQINIAEMKVFRSEVGSDKLMVLETDQDVTDSILSNIFNMQDVIDALKIEPV